MVTRPDETWHRLREWTGGQHSERLAALILDAEGFTDIDPVHPTGGKDGGVDAFARRFGEPWAMASYFSADRKTVGAIKAKLLNDLAGAKAHDPTPQGIAFVTNQKITKAERRTLSEATGETELELYHLDRMATILDRPHMAEIREKYLAIPAGQPPLRVTAEAIGGACRFINSRALLDIIVEAKAADLRKHADELRSNPPDALTKLRVASALRMMGHQISDQPKEPLTDEEIDQQIAALRRKLERRWQECQEYLASTAFPALRFRIANHAQSFLTDVQVILTFHGAKGIGYRRPEDFRWEKLSDPDWKPASGPYGIAPVIEDLAQLRLTGYPVGWENNDASDLEVTIDLPKLPPHPQWRHDVGDVVLVPQNPGTNAITVTYTVTAHEYGTAFEGEPFTLAIEETDVMDALRVVINSSAEK